MMLEELEKIICVEKIYRLTKILNVEDKGGLSLKKNRGKENPFFVKVLDCKVIDSVHRCLWCSSFWYWEYMIQIFKIKFFLNIFENVVLQFF